MNVKINATNKHCFQCGACYVACTKNAIQFELNSNSGLMMPHVIEDNCNECGLCRRTCPINTVEKPDLSTGFILNKVVKSTDPLIYERSSSGGAVTSIVKYLFEHKIINKAIGLESKNGVAVAVSASSFEKFSDLAGSKYQPGTTVTELKNITPEDRVAIVGLPCHIHAVNRLIENKVIKEENIVARIGLFCTIGRGQHGVDYIFDKYSERKNIVRFREGQTKQALKVGDKSVCTYEEFLNYNDYLFYPAGCFFCNDLFNVESDIAVGDPWGMNLGKNALVISHSSFGEFILKTAIGENYIEFVRDCTKEESINTQKHSYQFKIIDFEKRINLERRKLKKSGIICNVGASKFRGFNKTLANRLLVINSYLLNTKFGYALRKFIPSKIILRYYRDLLILRHLHAESNVEDK